MLLLVAVIAGVALVRLVVGWGVRHSAGGGPVQPAAAHTRFWIVQVTRVVTLAVAVAVIAAVWVGDVGRFATIAGVVTAGVAVALQRIITSFAAYLIILRGRVYRVGDRITVGGVRGDVVSVGFMQTAVLEMGLPPASGEDGQSWVAARQYTGRIVRISNDKIFDTPVYNYTREFPYLWEEMTFPIKYGADRARAESILLDAGRRHTDAVAREAAPALERLRRRYLVAEEASLEPRVYLRLTDNWVELALRFVAPVHGVRAIKDAIGREVLAALEASHLEIASATYEIVGLPPVRVATGTGAP